MSYDIELRAPQSTPAGRLADEIELSVLDGADRARHKRTVNALLSLNHGLEVFESEMYIELSEMETGIQITLFSEEGAVSVPYWHESNAREVLSQVAQYLRVLCEVGGYVAYDPQTGREVTARTGFSLDSNTYVFGVSSLRSATERPWWKFW